MKIVVDTNIVFSAILNSSGSIAKILILKGRSLELYSCNYLLEELSRHRSKLLRLTKLSDQELDEVILFTTKNIRFLNEQIIETKHLVKADEMISEVDKDDIPFLGLAYHLKAVLWTGDKKLINVLIQKRFKKVITTQILIEKLSIP